MHTANKSRNKNQAKSQCGKTISLFEHKRKAQKNPSSVSQQKGHPPIAGKA